MGMFPPNSFAGSVILNGREVENGMLVVAITLREGQYKPTTYTGHYGKGTYVIDVPSIVFDSLGAAEGDTIEFRVADFPISKAVSWQSGFFTVIDLVCND